MKGLGILLIEVYQRGVNLSFGSVKGLKVLNGFKKSRKHSISVIDSYLNDSAAAVKRDAKF